MQIAKPAVTNKTYLWIEVALTVIGITQQF